MDMSNAQTHLIVGTLTCLTLAFFLYKFVHVNLLVLFAGVVIGIIASEFPDIDHPKSLPRKVLRGLMPALILFIFIYLFFAWRIWTKNFLMISLFFATPFLIIFSYEYFIPKHRRATHKWPGMAMLIAVTIPLASAVGLGITNFLIIASFAVLGFSTHILLDHL